MEFENQAECGDCPWTGYEDEVQGVTDAETGAVEVSCPDCGSPSVTIRT